MSIDNINVFRELETMRELAPRYAKAKADRTYLEKFREAKMAILMQAAELEGHKSSAAQEREARAHPEYEVLLLGLKEAVEEEEKLRWQIEASRATIEVWRSLSANERNEKQFLGG